jgi:hypothetical protein
MDSWHIRKNRQSEDVYRQKSYFHFRFNTNSGGFFPMQSMFYLKPQGHQMESSMNDLKLLKRVLNFLRSCIAAMVQNIL